MTRWKTVLGKRFPKQYKNPDVQIKQRADHAIEELKNPDSPEVATCGSAGSLV